MEREAKITYQGNRQARTQRFYPVKTVQYGPLVPAGQTPAAAQSDQATNADASISFVEANLPAVSDVQPEQEPDQTKNSQYPQGQQCSKGRANSDGMRQCKLITAVARRRLKSTCSVLYRPVDNDLL